jgi:hypothetical protein
MENNTVEIEEKICKRCGVSNQDAKFGPKRWVCVKCCSAQNNQRLKDKNYYKEYYKSHKNEFIEKSMDYYTRVVKPSKPEERKVGRPKKVIHK